MSHLRDTESCLNNTNIPLTERLTFAYSLFNTHVLPISAKESIILNWLNQEILKSGTTETWDTLYKCIVTVRFDRISYDILCSVVDTIITKLEEINTELAIKFGFTLINDVNFQYYFEKNIEKFFLLFSKLLKITEDESTAINIIQKLFKFSYFYENKNCVNYFLPHFFKAAIEYLLSCSSSVFCRKLIILTRVILYPSSRTDSVTYIETILNDDRIENEIDDSIINHFKTFYESEIEFAKLSFRILFESFLEKDYYNNDLKFKFIILFTSILGFDYATLFNVNIPVNTNTKLEKSLAVMSEVLISIEGSKMDLNTTVKDISLLNFLKYFTQSMLKFHKHLTFYSSKVLQSILSLDDVIIQDSLSKILLFVVSSKKNEDMMSVYSEILIILIEYYNKMNKIDVFTLSFLKSTKKSLLNKQKSTIVKIKFAGEQEDVKVMYVQTGKDIFPEQVASYFKQCINLLSTTQVYNMLEFFLNNFNKVLTMFSDYIEDKKYVYIEVIGELFCSFLTASKFADSAIIKSRINNLKEYVKIYWDILEKLGSNLLKIEHNEGLMFIFLKLCYTWAEIIMSIRYYYSSIFEDFGEIVNVTKMHDYLSPEQWKLLIQRIKNFGETPTKLILQQIMLQKLKAAMLFEYMDHEIESTCIVFYSSDLETNWALISQEPILPLHIIPRLDSNKLVTLSEYILENCIKHKNFEILFNNHVINCRDLVLALFYACLSKLTNSFDRKRKLNDTSIFDTNCRQLFNCIDKDLFIKKCHVDMVKINKAFKKMATVKEIGQIDETNFSNCMYIIQQLPIIFLSEEIQVTLFTILLAIRLDIYSNEQKAISEKCEFYLFGVLNHSNSPNICKYLSFDYLMNYIMQYTVKYKNLIDHVIKKVVKSDESIHSFSNYVKLIGSNISDDKYLFTACKALVILSNNSELNISKENNKLVEKYVTKLNKTIVEYITSSYNPINVNKLESFIIIYKFNLTKGNLSKTEKLTAIIQPFIDYVYVGINENNFQYCQRFLKLIFTSMFENLSINFMTLWNHNKSVTNRIFYMDVLSVCVEKIDDKDFKKIIFEFMESCIYFLNNKNMNKLAAHLNTMEKLIHLNLNKNQLYHLLNQLENLQKQLIAHFTNNINNQEFRVIVFQFHIKLIENSKITLTVINIDILFKLVDYLMDEENGTSINNYKLAFSIIEKFFQLRKELVTPRIPKLLILIRIFYSYLSCNGISKTINNMNAETTSTIINFAFRFERLINLFKEFKNDLQKLVPNLICDFMHSFSGSLNRDVKKHLETSIMMLIDLCDDYGTPYLLRILPRQHKELFENIHSIYQKEYKFKGKS